jgi:putative inorganic carbon (hco3(-)) transporter
MLGEHGFVGLGLFLLLGVVTWFTASRLARKTKGDEELGSWMPDLMRMVQVSIIGYAAGGAFLSLAYLDLPYYILGFVVTASAIAKRRAVQLKQTKAPVVGAAVGSSLPVNPSTGTLGGAAATLRSGADQARLARSAPGTATQ